MDKKQENVREVVDAIFKEAADNGTHDDQIIAGLTLKNVRPIETTSFQNRADVLQMIILVGANAAKCYIRKPSMPQDSKTECLVSEECFYDLVDWATQYRDVIKSIDDALTISNPQARMRCLDEIKRKHPNKRMSELIQLRAFLA